MKFNVIHRVLLLLSVWVLAFAAFSCGDESVPAGKAATPTEAYKMLYSAVKSKNTADIRKMLSKDSMKLAESAAAQNKKPIEEVLKNGLTATTFAKKMPVIRDERVMGKYGAVEVFNKKNTVWENLPFIMEDGGWKLAIGNMFAGNFVSPGKSRTTIEKENANAMGKNNLVPYGNGNINTNVFNVKPINKNPPKSKRAK